MPGQESPGQTARASRGDRQATFRLWPISGKQVITDIVQILQPIAGQYQQVMSYDPSQPQPGLTWDPLLPEFSTLHNMDPLHGYWIKATNEVSLALSGGKVPSTTTLAMSAGWNLVSYLPDVTLPVTVALSSIDGKYDLVMGYDPCEPQPGRTYDPRLPEFSTLLELDPRFGYWIYMSAPGTLVYPTDSSP